MAIQSIINKEFQSSEKYECITKNQSLRGIADVLRGSVCMCVCLCGCVCVCVFVRVCVSLFFVGILDILDQCIDSVSLHRWSYSINLHICTCSL